MAAAIRLRDPPGGGTLNAAKPLPVTSAAHLPSGRMPGLPISVEREQLSGCAGCATVLADDEGFEQVTAFGTQPVCGCCARPSGGFPASRAHALLNPSGRRQFLVGKWLSYGRRVKAA